MTITWEWMVSKITGLIPTATLFSFQEDIFFWQNKDSTHVCMRAWLVYTVQKSSLDYSTTIWLEQFFPGTDTQATGGIYSLKQKKCMNNKVFKINLATGHEQIKRLLEKYNPGLQYIVCPFQGILKHCTWVKNMINDIFIFGFHKSS